MACQNTTVQTKAEIEFRPPDSRANERLRVRRGRTGRFIGPRRSSAKTEQRIGRQRIDEGDVPSTQFYEEIKFVAAAPYRRPGRGGRFPSGLLQGAHPRNQKG